MPEELDELLVHILDAVSSANRAASTTTCSQPPPLVRCGEAHPRSFTVVHDVGLLLHLLDDLAMCSDLSLKCFNPSHRLLHGLHDIRETCQVVDDAVHRALHRRQARDHLDEPVELPAIIHGFDATCAKNKPGNPKLTRAYLSETCSFILSSLNGFGLEPKWLEPKWLRIHTYIYIYI